MQADFKTVYLAGKITGDPFYQLKFHDAARALTAAGLAVVNPALLPSEGFCYGAYMRMSSAMLDECEAACFLPDWIDSDGAMSEYGRAKAKGKHIFMFSDWKEERTAGEIELSEVISETKTGKRAFKCLSCNKINVFPAKSGDGRPCWYCGGHIVPIGYAKSGAKVNGK